MAPDKHTTREICKLCYHVNRVGFSVPDEIWEFVVPEHLRRRVVCLQCFTRIADEKRVRWDKEIEFFPVSAVTADATRSAERLNDLTSGQTQNKKEKHQ